MERQQAVPGRRRALGKDRDHLARAAAPRRSRGRRAARRACVRARGRACRPRRPAAPTSGHALHVGLGDEARARNDGVDRHDVEPRDVVGDEQAAACRPACRRARSAMPRTASIFRRPPADPLLARRRVERRETRTGRSPARAGRGPRRARSRATARSAAHQRRRHGVTPPRRRRPRPATSGAAHAPGHLVASERRVLAAARQRSCRRRSTTRRERRRRGRRRRPRASRLARDATSNPWKRASTAAGRLVTVASVCGQRRASLALAPLERRAEQQLEAGRARLGFGERQVLGVLADRRVVADERVDGAVGERGADRVAVALLAQRRHQPHRRVEVADVDVDQVQLVDADVAGHRQPLGLGLADQLDAGGAAQPAQVDARAGVAHELEDRRQRDRLGEHRHARQAEARRQRPLGGDAVAEPGVVRPQPDRVAEGRRVLQRAVQHQRVADRRRRPARSRCSRLRSARPSRSAPRRRARASARRADRGARGRGCGRGT